MKWNDESRMAIYCKYKYRFNIIMFKWSYLNFVVNFISLITFRKEMHVVLGNVSYATEFGWFFFYILLGVKVEKPAKMPEHRKISTKTPKVKSSALKRTENADNVSLASSDGRFCQSIAWNFVSMVNKVCNNFLKILMCRFQDNRHQPRYTTRVRRWNNATNLQTKAQENCGVR